MIRRAGVLVVVAALAWLAGACGGGGGGPTAPPGPPPPPPTPITFNAIGTPGAMTVHLAKAGGTEDTILRLEVRVNEVSGLYGMGFDLEYPAALFNYRGGSQADGGFLSADGTRAEVLARKVDDGTVIVGASRIGDVEGVDGSGLVLTLDFTAVASGNGSFTFSANDAFDRDGEPLDGTVWQGGDVRVNL